ncbi:hypothetical protein JTB14_027722 [Gonioctena quinquepunctata]|nr:hypothetical protein JTB14_027722 [Gonioctena quinquepunctata]
MAILNSNGSKALKCQSKQHISLSNYKKKKVLKITKVVIQNANMSLMMTAIVIIMSMTTMISITMTRITATMIMFRFHKAI